MILKPKALSAAVKRARVMGATDRGADTIRAGGVYSPQNKAEDMTAPTTSATPKIALDQRASSRHDKATTVSNNLRKRSGSREKRPAAILQGESRRMIGNLAVEARKRTKPPISQIEVDCAPRHSRRSERTPEVIADNQHPDHQLPAYG